jgi:hypothetical protein
LGSKEREQLGPYQPLAEHHVAEGIRRQRREKA